MASPSASRVPTFKPARAPKLRLPAGSWDTHFHIFGPKDRFPFAPNAPIDPADATKEQMLALHRHLGIERGVIVHTALHGMDLRATEDALAATKGQYLGIALLPPDISKAELKRLDAIGFRGVRYHFMKHLQQAASVEQILELAPRLAALGWHLQIHMESTLLGDIGPRLSQAAVPIVIDHIGRIDAGLGLEQAPFAALMRLMESDNVWVKVSGCDRITRQGPPYADAVPFARHLTTTYPDRVVWGTDWPHPHHKGPIPDDGELVDIIAEIAPTEDLLCKLMVENPRRLYDKEPA